MGETGAGGVGVGTWRYHGIELEEAEARVSELEEGG